MKLSILICTVPSRVKTFLPKIVDEMEGQTAKINGNKKNKVVEYIYLGDNKARTVGEKRNDLLRVANGEYVVFVDDDDMVTEDYVSELLRGCESGADVVNFRVMCSVNGGEYKRVDYDAKYRANRNFNDHYERMPNHIMCIRRDIALKAGFPEKNMGEDDDFSRRVRPMIKRQAVIKKPLYYYTFSHQISETQ